MLVQLFRRSGRQDTGCSVGSATSAGVEVLSSFVWRDRYYDVRACAPCVRACVNQIISAHLPNSNPNRNFCSVQIEPFGTALRQSVWSLSIIYLHVNGKIELKQ